MVISMYLEDSTAWRPDPMAHPVIATVAASITFLVTYPRRSLVTLLVFMPLAFAVITIVSMMVGIVMLMPS